MKLILVCLCFLALFGVQAQEKYNFLAVNSVLLEDAAGPFYFTEQGNSKDSYARADLLADALGVSFSLESDHMRFESQSIAITLKTTTDIISGLNKHPDVLVANNQAYESPMGIIVDGHPYVAITPITKALGGQSGWQADDDLIWVHYKPQTPVTAPEPQVQAQPTATLQGNVLATPRYGLQKEGHTRIVLDLPPGTFYELLADSNNLIVKLPRLTAGGFNQALNKDPNLERFRYGLINETLALIITTRYPLNAQGNGYRFSLLAPTADIPHERLVLEFSPDFQGSPAVQTAPAFTVEDLPAMPLPTLAQTPAGHQKVVVIDAGHGGNDPGAVGYAVEKEVVLSVSLKLKALLEAQGIQVILTRDSDYFIELEDRADYATTDINLFVSIHANAVNATEAHGVETWVFGQPLEPALLALAKEENGGNTAAGEARTQEALQVAEGILGDVMLESQLSYSMGLAQLVQDEMVAATGAKDRGVRKNAFYVLRKARSPSILIETGFVSNPHEGSLLATDAYQSTLAQSIANGIISFFNHGGIVASLDH